jgi:aryl-alcohol dehydrogenase-like predicted oxidoreductase
MNKRILGRSGIEVSALGLGCWAIGGPYWHNGNPVGWGKMDDKESIRAIQKGLEMGINFLDTADVYGCGHSERLIGKALKGKRNRVVIATKFGIAFDEQLRKVTGERADTEYIRAACEASLKRLKTDYIDLYQYHRGESSDGESVREVLEELVLEGKIRYYGWSTDTPWRAQIFAQGKNCTAIQQDFSVVSGNDETLKICEDQNLASINRGPLAMGILTAKFSENTKFPDDDVRYGFMNLKEGVFAQRLKKAKTLKDVLTGGGRSIVQGSLCWLWARSIMTIPIPGFKTVKQVEENCSALNFEPFSPEEMNEIKNILKN